MGLTLMNRLNRKGGSAGAGGGGNGNGRNVVVHLTAKETAKKIAYKICGRKGGLS